MHLIEKYFQTVMNCLTMTNIKCKGNKEIDLLVIDPKTQKKYHVEARISTTFSLKSEDTFSNRINNGVPFKDGINFLYTEKFEHKNVKDKILEIFGEEPYERILVVFKIGDDLVIPMAEKLYGIKVWLMNDLLIKLMEKRISGSRDEVLRLTELMYHSSKKYWKEIYEKLYPQEENLERKEEKHSLKQGLE